MYYYKIDNDYVIKYDVKLDKESLKLLRLEMIENCSHIIHKYIIQLIEVFHMII